MISDKLIAVVIGQDCEKTIDMCISSLKDADKIVFVDGGSTDNTLNIIGNRAKILYHKFDKENPLAISKQRQFYLDYLKQNHLFDMCIVLDADEVLDDDGVENIKNWVSIATDSLERYPIADVAMQHLINNLITVDATQQIHFVPGRLFIVKDELFYPDGEHTVLNYKGKEKEPIKCADTTIWHLGYLGGIWDVKKRYDEQKKRNSGHPKEYLNAWYQTHIFGQYPMRLINPIELPTTILKYYGIDKDAIYFANRGIEVKHYQMAKQWSEYFDDNDYRFTILEMGCGRAPYGLAFQTVCEDAEYHGIDISEFAIRNTLVPFDDVEVGDITTYKSEYPAKLVIAFDVLEHVKINDLDKAIQNVIDNSEKYILISVPVVGDPNLNNDPTHKIKENKDWWINKFTSKGVKLIKTPEHFLYKEQIMIFEK